MVYYEAITKFAKQHLKSGGVLFFEINEMFGKEVAEICENYGFDEVEIIQDFNAKDRFVIATVKSL